GMRDPRDFIPAREARFGPIRFENVTLTSAEGQTLIDRLHIAIEPGDRFCLAGDSGTGKTTVLMLMLGMVRPTSGRVTIGGVDVARLPLAARKRFFLLARAQPAFVPAPVIDNVALHRPLDDDRLERILAATRLERRLTVAALR